ncbi:MAG: hypothetical protein JWQ35_955, partial [Bacteriovoracaceae bacterium]|nr:hypothetical protein [Bacteriovoracaceae bacterium]
MKKFLVTAISAVFISSSVFAYLPVSALTTMSLPVYGVYMSADATCTTGMVATVPLTTTPKTINFAAAQSQSIGSGNVPATIGCVVIVIGNSLSSAWSAGTYTTTSGTGNNAVSDSSCNAGGTTTGQTICNSSAAVTWPQQIVTDAAAIGLTLTNTCLAKTTEIVPLVLSTNSICTGQAAADASTAACVGVNMNNFTIPLTTTDATHGTKLTAPSAAGDLKFVVN